MHGPVAVTSSGESVMRGEHQTRTLFLSGCLSIGVALLSVSAYSLGRHRRGVPSNSVMVIVGISAIDERESVRVLLEPHIYNAAVALMSYRSMPRILQRIVFCDDDLRLMERALLRYYDHHREHERDPYLAMEYDMAVAEVAGDRRQLDSINRDIQRGNNLILRLFSEMQTARDATQP